ncbi:MAG TPA: hypothetical protein VIJ12_08390 [Candidatus Baltobacteraceae bacterium]
MPLFKGVLGWLGLERPAPGIGLRPHGEFELTCGADEAHARCIDALVNVAGANVQSDDGTSIEAGFGIVNSERLRIGLQPIDDATTRVRIEAFYPARLAPSPRSMAIDALVKALRPRD